MTVGQERAWDTYWEKMGNDVKSLPEGPLDFDSWFGRSAPVLLEIGSGMGETTSQLVAAAPELNYVAVEVYKPGLAQLLLRGEHLGGLDNLRVLRGDAVDLLTNHIALASLHGVRIFFRTRGRRRSTTSAGWCSRSSWRCSRPGWSPAACCTSRRTGSTTRTRCSRCVPTSGC